MSASTEGLKAVMRSSRTAARAIAFATCAVGVAMIDGRTVEVTLPALAITLFVAAAIVLIVGNGVSGTLARRAQCEAPAFAPEVRPAGYALVLLALIIGASHEREQRLQIHAQHQQGGQTQEQAQQDSDHTGVATPTVAEASRSDGHHGQADPSQSIFIEAPPADPEADVADEQRSQNDVDVLVHAGDSSSAVNEHIALGGAA